MVTRDWVRRKFEDVLNDVPFFYNGENGCIIPHNTKRYVVAYGKNSVEVNSPDEVMNVKIIDGKSIDEVFDDIEF